MIWNKLKTHLQYNYGQHCWILRWICCFNEWKQTWTLKRRNWNKIKLRMTSVLGSLHPTGHDAADFLVQPWMTYMYWWQRYWPLTFCSHEAFSGPSGSDLIPKWTASVHTGPRLFMSTLFTRNLSAVVRFWRLSWKQEPVLDDIGLFTRTKRQST